MPADPMTPAELRAWLEVIADAPPGPAIYGYGERDRMMLAAVLEYLDREGNREAVDLFCAASNFGGRRYRGMMQ